MTTVISGAGLRIEDIAAVARGATVSLTEDAVVLSRLAASREVLRTAIERGEQIYGVTTLFGAMADRRVGPGLMNELQTLALWSHKGATGPRLPEPDVRAAMLLRANSLLKGASGIRLEIIERYVTFLNHGAIPHVFQRGSIGASGDLAPLSYIAGALLGLHPAFKVDFQGRTLDCHSVLAELNLKPLPLLPKEGLALNNGTGASTGVAANVVSRAFELAALALGIHALYAQALLATCHSFEPFVHAMKPHPGQVWIAAEMRKLLAGSKVIRDDPAGEFAIRTTKLIQDRYSLRCLPQYIGPIVDALACASKQIEVEANSANDNPLIDPDSGKIYHTGNFLAQYTGVAMDSVRFHMGLLTKHLDTQIALLMAPEFSNGLSPSLVGNGDGPTNVGFKTLQVAGNQMMPLIAFYGQSMVDRYPTHAEQFNQNINSQAMNAANLAREQLDVLEHYLAVALFCAVQAIELRAKLASGSYDARTVLSPATQGLYSAARNAASGPPDPSRPVHWNDLEAFFQPKIEGLLNNISGRGDVLCSMAAVEMSLRTL
jgi:phenylalanine ammonia-lyase